MKTKIYLLSLISIFFLGTSCSDFLEPEDTKYTTGDKIPEILDRNTDAIIQGVYSRSIEYAFYAKRHDDFGQKSIDLAVDLAAEDVVHYANRQWFSAFYQFNDRLASNRFSPARQWQYAYAQIRDLNNIILALPDGVDLGEAQKHLKGEALALRAHHYFILVNFYQTGGTWEHIKDLPGVPIYTEPSLDGYPRGKVSDVYAQILADYESAIPLLEGFESNGPTRINQLSAKALAARAHLYAGSYENALRYASDVVNGAALMSTVAYTQGFADISNVEWLWGVNITAENSTGYPSFFSMMDPHSPGYGELVDQPKTVDRRLYDNISANDIRKQVFEDGEYEVPYVQNKFVDASLNFQGDYVYLRAAEAYYIKAEAEARTGNLSEAKRTLDAISNARATDGVHTYIWASDEDGLINNIFLQKRIELWGEGLGLFEFNRLEKTIDRTYAGSNHPTGNINSGDRPLPWHDPLRTFQIPTKELEGNPNIAQGDQNP